MDGVIHIGQIVDVVLSSGELLCIRQELLHLFLGSAVPQLQVVQHGIVLLSETLVSVLDGLHIGAELVGVVRHIDQRHVRDGSRLCGVTAQAADQRSREAGHLLHIGVGGEASCAECCVRIGLYHTGIFLEQGLHAADALFQRSPLVDGTAHDHRGRQRHRDGHRLCQACQLALDLRQPGGHAVLQLDHRRGDHLSNRLDLITHRLDLVAGHILDGHGGDDFLTQRLKSLPQLLRSPVCRCSVKPGCASLIPGGLQFPACPLHITPEGTLLLLDAAEHRRHIIFNGNCAFDRAHRRLTSYSSENIFARSSKATSIDA